MILGTGTGDNYAYLVIDDKTKDAMIIDPANPPEYLTPREHSSVTFYMVTSTD